MSFRLIAKIRLTLNCLIPGGFKELWFARFDTDICFLNSRNFVSSSLKLVGTQMKVFSKIMSEYSIIKSFDVWSLKSFSRFSLIIFSYKASSLARLEFALIVSNRVSLFYVTKYTENCNLGQIKFAI